MKVSLILLPIVALLFYQNCGPRHERWGDGEGLASHSEEREVSIAIFQETLYPLLQGASRCAGCHGQQQVPLHSHPDPAQAHDTNWNLGLVNFDNPEQSVLVEKIRQGHAGFPPSFADSLAEAIREWADLYGATVSDL